MPLGKLVVTQLQRRQSAGYTRWEYYYYYYYCYYYYYYYY